MTTKAVGLLAAAGCLLCLATCAQPEGRPVTVPFVLDHNRMLVDAEIQRQDGTWRAARLWVDSGNPEFLLSEELARDLGLDLSRGGAGEGPGSRTIDLAVPPTIRLGGKTLRFDGVASKVLIEPRWLFGTMHNDANLPSTVLRHYQVVFDYPAGTLTLAEPGVFSHRGERLAAAINAETGIVQVDAFVGDEKLSFALDNGASYSFTSDEVLERIARRYPEAGRCTGAIGGANIWGWWPDEPEWPVLRVPEVDCGAVRLAGVGVAGLPNFLPGGVSVGEWYSSKTARPVDGFLGPNAFKAYRVGIDYAEGAVYLLRGKEIDSTDMDLVGLTVRPLADGGYEVLGVAAQDGRPGVGGVEPGDRLLHIDDLEVTGATMGSVVDALRGAPGEVRTLRLERDGEPFTVEAVVRRYL